MTDAERTTSAPLGASPQQTSIDDERSEMFESASMTALRRELGVRPIAFKADSEHPDTEPCPPWCWIAEATKDYYHEVDQRHPIAATHTTDDNVPEVAL